jgi:hypothetical protein
MTARVTLDDLIKGRDRMGLGEAKGNLGKVKTFPRANGTAKKTREQVIEVPTPVVTTRHEDNRILFGAMDKHALVRYLFPLAIGTFFGGLVYHAFGIPGVLVMSIMFIGVMGAVMSS